MDLDEVLNCICAFGAGFGFGVYFCRYIDWIIYRKRRG
jgi:hypothetical protein